MGENSNKEDLRNVLCPLGGLLGMVNGIALLKIMGRPVLPMYSIVVPIGVIAYLSLVKFGSLVVNAETLESEKDPIKSCLKLSYRTFSPY